MKLDMNGSEENVVYGDKVYVASPRGLVKEVAARDIARFVDVQLHGVDMEGVPLAEVISPVGISLRVSDQVPDGEMTTSFSVSDEGVVLHMREEELGRMDEGFGGMSPSVFQNAFAGVATIGFARYHEAKTGDVVARDQLKRTYEQLLAATGEFLEDLAGKLEIDGELLKGVDVWEAEAPE